MSSSGFPRFLDLAPELRAQVWSHAVEIYVQELLENLPPRYDPNDADFAKYLDYEVLVDCSPILATCREARQATISYFRYASGKSNRRYRYFPARLLRLGELEEHQLRESYGPIILSQPLPTEEEDGEQKWTPEQRRATWEISNGRFTSPAHLVNVVSKYISGGTDVERLVLNFRVSSEQKVALDRMSYWPFASQWFRLGDAGPYPDRDTLAGANFHYIADMYESVIDETILDLAQPPPGAYPVMSISRDRKVRAAAELSGSRDTELKLHLLRIMDLLDASRDQLPKLKHIEVNCEAVSYPMEDDESFSGFDWVMFECRLEGDQVIGWFTRYDGH